MLVAGLGLREGLILEALGVGATRAPSGAAAAPWRRSCPALPAGTRAGPGGAG